MGLAEGPDGSLYISESNKGKIWRVMYKGQKENFSDRRPRRHGKTKIKKLHWNAGFRYAINFRSQMKSEGGNYTAFIAKIVTSRMAKAITTVFRH